MGRLLQCLSYYLFRGFCISRYYLSILYCETLKATDITFNPVTITAGLSNASPASSVSVCTTATATDTNSGTSTSAKSQSTNVAVQGSPAFGAGVLGALGVAVAVAIL